jgi:hypothetical protein
MSEHHHTEESVIARWPHEVKLLERWLDGEIEEAEFQQLDTSLASHPALAEYACQRLAEHRLLGLLFQQSDVGGICNAIETRIRNVDSVSTENILNSLPIQRTNSVITFWNLANSTLIAAAAVMLAAFVLWPLWKPNPQPSQSIAIQKSVPDEPKFVATLLLAEKCRWKDDRQLAEGERLSGRHELISGLAIVRFDGGAELILRDETAVEFLSPGTARVVHGNVVVRATDEATGFRLLTPASELVDLGTEFSVRVGPTGATTLNVLEGEVSVRSLDTAGATPQILPAGQAVVIDDARATPRNVIADTERFDTFVKNIHPVGRSDLMYAYEGFFHDEGEVPLRESGRGKGWIGPWRQRTEREGFRADEDVSDCLDIVHGQMNVTWPVPGGENGMLQLAPGKTFRIREMQKPIDLNSDGIYYFSFMVREPDYENRPRRSRPQEGIRLTFRSSDDYYGEALSFGISPELHPQIRTGRGVGFFSAADAPSDQTTLWIGKVIARTSGEDEVSFRIFSESDKLTYAEPSAWHVVSKGLDLSAQLNLTVLTSQGTAARIVDELRIGPTWRSVTPLKETVQ